MTLFSVSGRARVTDVKMKASAQAGTEIVVGLAFRRATLTGEERAALQDYYGNFVDVSIAAVQYEAVDPHNNPMDQELARRQAEAGQEERMRPLPGETCIDCAAIIGEDDDDSGFHVPPLGAPSPLCGPCAIRRREEGPEEPTDPQSYCPLGDHWLALPIGETCEIHGGPTYFDPAAAEKADEGAEVPEVVEAPVPELEGAVSWCPNCRDAYPFPAGGECWVCKAGTVSEEPAGVEAPSVADDAAYVAPGEERPAPEDGQGADAEPVAASRRRR